MFLSQMQALPLYALALWLTAFVPGLHSGHRLWAHLPGAGHQQMFLTPDACSLAIWVKLNRSFAASSIGGVATIGATR
jgi:hypothetical protein